MIVSHVDKAYPAVQTLIENRVASRVQAKDATLYAFDAEAQACCEKFMGWADLASKPPVPIAQIQDYAQRCRERGMESVLLLAQGGSSVAAMALAKFCGEGLGLRFFSLDSDSPVRLREMLGQVDLATTIVLVSSKSGGTIEMRSYLAAVRAAFAEKLPYGQISEHLVAITDPGSPLEAMAREEGWDAIFPGEPTVGGRFSALSVFGLVPAALVGVDLDALLDAALDAEKRCSKDDEENPAINLAAFMYDNYRAGRDKIALLLQARGRVLGLWIEQLVAESLGKNGLGILPNIEIDPLLLASDPGDRTVIAYQTDAGSWDELKNFEASLAHVDAGIPRADLRVDTVDDLAEHFVMWEYATAMCGYLMQVCPFDQPDVQQAKTNVLQILAAGLPAPDFTDESLVGAPIEVHAAPCLGACSTVHDALSALMASVKPGDYFCLNAFLPFAGEGRREALERIRHAVAAHLGVASCLEIGPRYLHSSGQLYKGGPNTGVFLVISADEPRDVPLAGEKAPSLGALAEAQATGDALTLVERGRRVAHLHLPDHAGATLRIVADEVEKVLNELSR